MRYLFVKVIITVRLVNVVVRRRRTATTEFVGRGVRSGLLTKLLAGDSRRFQNASDHVFFPFDYLRITKYIYICI